MDDFIDQLEELTLHLVNNLENASDIQLIEFVEQREIIMNQILSIVAISKFEDKDSARIQQILQYDPRIVSRMQQFKEAAAREIDKFASGRIQKNGYEIDLHYDGVLFDRKK